MFLKLVIVEYNILYIVYMCYLCYIIYSVCIKYCFQGKIFQNQVIGMCFLTLR